MQPIAVLSAKSIWLINQAEINPKGLRIFPNLADALTDIYDFDPQPEETIDAPSPTVLSFKNGQFDTKQGLVRVGLELFKDGIVADSSVSSEVTEQFMQHVIDWATSSFGLVFDPALMMNRLYSSELVVRLEHSPWDQLAQLDSFSDTLTSLAGNKTFIPSGLTFTATSGSELFSIERRPNVPADANVVYSKAPFDSTRHMQALSEFDAMLISRGSAGK